MSGTDDRDSRYAAIMRRLEQRKQQETSAPIQSLLSSVLDTLNAAGMLAAIKRRPPKRFSAYGPKTFTGSLAVSGEGIPEQWAASVIWHKPRGYAAYQTLGLLGIWALGHGSEVRVLVGEKTLPFNAPIFNPESYYHHIKRKFNLHYAGDASPPLSDKTGSILFDAQYDETERLETRKAIEAVLRQWVLREQP